MKIRTVIFSFITVAAVLGCATQRKLSVIQSESMTALLSLPDREEKIRSIQIDSVPRKDTIRVLDFEGREVFLMNAVKDGNGEMVAHEVLDAAVVTARFRNVAERHGKVDLQFQVIVPAAMQDSKWQLRFYPDMYIMQDSTRLESVVITGTNYRKAQLRGYQQYERFLSSIITDSTKFINTWQLEIFLQRNLPRIYALKRDTTYVSDELLCSLYGVTEQQAVRHYTDHLRKSRNEYRKSRKGDMFRRYVKVPIVTDGLRLDTLMQNSNGDFVYNYTQTISTRPKLRKVEIALSGEIFEQDKKLYDVPPGGTLTFYISSLSAFVDGTERYLTKVIERRVEANTACYIDFALGKATVDETLGFNREEMGRIKSNLRDLARDTKFDLDSITISAFASPEGGLRANEALSLRRAASAAEYFNAFLAQVRDSISQEEGVLITYDDSGVETVSKAETSAPIRFISHSGGENWGYLDRLVASDNNLSDSDRENYDSCRTIADPDRREKALSGLPFYKYLRQSLYPRLRVVNFDFYLHRKGMVKDTVHTTVLDSTYMAGVQAIRDRDYERAITLLRPYNDYNTAIAYCSMDYNASAMQILETLERTPQVLYMLAVLYSRRGDDQSAVQCYLDACHGEPGFVHRGNLDPEISSLIKRYSLLEKLENNMDNQL